MPLDHTKPLTLADVLERLENDPSLVRTRTRDRVSAVNRVAAMLHRAPADIPTATPALRVLLDGIHPAQHGITAKTLSNNRSALADILRAVGAIPKDEQKAVPSETWVGFLDHAGAKHQAWSLSRMVTYCCNRGIEPDAVSDDVMAAFQSYLDARLLAKNPATLCKEMAQTWNGIVSRNDLPLARLTYERGVRHRSRPLASYPETLQKEIAAYLDRLAHVDLFDESGPDKPMRPATLKNVQAHLRYHLDALVSAGGSPDEFVNLAEVVTPENMKIAFKEIMARTGANSVPASLHNIAATLTAIARHHLRIEPQELEKILYIKRKVASDPKGMSDKNRERLTQFNDWENVVRLISLPAVLMDRANTNPTSRRSALLALHSVAMAILLSCPLRAKNLASLDLERHVITHRSGTHSLYTLRIEGREVKNGEPIEVKLNSRNSQLMHTYITRFRPLISGIPGTALFPQQSNGAPRNPTNLSGSLKDLIYRETGLTVNTHLFRHIAAKLYLREKPGDFETVRRLLKHRKLQTTMDFYAELSNQWAHDHYDETVLSKWGGGNA